MYNKWHSYPLYAHDVCPAALDVCPQHSSEEVIRWEESKKWQKKLATLRAKLMEKSREVDEVHKQSKSLKDIIER